MEEPGGLQSMGSQSVRHNRATSLSFHFKYTDPEARHTQLEPCSPLTTVSLGEPPGPHFYHQKNENNNKTHLTGTQNSVWLRVNAVCVPDIITGVMNLCPVKEKTSGPHHYEAKSSLGHLR